jgi:uncharacterized protein YeaO (DUF488 family)
MRAPIESHRTSYRVLVDRLWPRGVSKADAALDEWAKDAAPSGNLRRWYGHDPKKFEEFSRRYRGELAQPPGSDAIAHLCSLGGNQRVTLLTATRDVSRSGAQVLLDVLTLSLPSGMVT